MLGYSQMLPENLRITGEQYESCLQPEAKLGYAQV